MTYPTHPCPDGGAWRAWLDQEDQSPALAAHLATCAGCQNVVPDMRVEAAGVRDALSLLAPASLPSAADTALARERLDWRRRQSQPRPAPVRASQPRRTFVSRLSTPWRVAASGLAAALVLSLVVAVTPDGKAVAASFLAQFRSQGVTAVEITPQTQGEIVRTLSALSNLGTLQTPSGAATRPEIVARGAADQARTMSVSEATAAVGFPLLTPDPKTLPAGIDRTPRVQVMPASQIRFKFEKAKAAAYLQSTGHPDYVVPDKYDGATLVVSIPTAAILQYANPSSREALIVGQAGELVVDVEGGTVSLDEMHAFLLGLPGLPSGVVNQLKNMKSWNDTLPIPVPVDRVSWRPATLNKSQGLLLNDNSGVGSAAIWHANGHLYGLAGSLKATDLQSIADGLGSH
jgi:hypothetical protein